MHKNSTAALPPRRLLATAIGIAVASSTSLALAEQKKAVELDSLKVQAEQDSGSRTEQSASAKYTAPLLDTPQTITIIDNGLRPSLDKSAGGEIADNLDAMYDYMTRRLLEANLKNEVGMVDEVHRLLADLRGAWVAIDGKEGQPAPMAASPLSAFPMRAWSSDAGIPSLIRPMLSPGTIR